MNIFQKSIKKLTKGNTAFYNCVLEHILNLKHTYDTYYRQNVQHILNYSSPVTEKMEEIEDINMQQLYSVLLTNFIVKNRSEHDQQLLFYNFQRLDQFVQTKNSSLYSTLNVLISIYQHAQIMPPKIQDEKKWQKIKYLKHVSIDKLYLQLINFKSQYSSMLNCFNNFFQEFLKQQLINNTIDKLNIPQLYLISEQLNKLNESEFVQMTVYCQEQLTVLDSNSLEHKFFSQYLVHLIELNMKTFLVSLTKDNQALLSPEQFTGFPNIDQYLYYQRRIQEFIGDYFSYDYSKENDVFQALQQIIQFFITQNPQDDKQFDILNIIKQTAFYINYSYQLQKQMNRTIIIRDKQFNYIHIENMEQYLQKQQRIYFRNRLEYLFKKRINRFVDVNYENNKFTYSINKDLDQRTFIYDNFGCLMKEDEVQILMDEITTMKQQVIEQLNKDEQFFMRLLRQKGGNLYKIYMDRKQQFENDLKLSQLNDDNAEIINEELKPSQTTPYVQNQQESSDDVQPEIYQQLVQQSPANSSIQQPQLSDTDKLKEGSIFNQLLESQNFQTTVILKQNQDHYFNKQIVTLAKLEFCLNQFIKYQLIYSDEYKKIMNIVIRQHFIVKDQDEKSPQLEHMDQLLFKLLNIEDLKPELQAIETKLNQLQQAVQNISQLQKYMHKNKYHREQLRFKRLCMCVFVLNCKVKHYLELKQFEIQFLLDKYSSFSLQYIKKLQFIDQLRQDFKKLVQDVLSVIQVDKQFIHLFHRINDFLNNVNQFLIITQRDDLSEMTQEQIKEYEFNNANQIVRLLTVYQRVLTDVTIGLGLQ